jgi:hypothetical protein
MPQEGFQGEVFKKYRGWFVYKNTLSVLLFQIYGLNLGSNKIKYNSQILVLPSEEQEGAMILSVLLAKVTMLYSNHNTGKIINNLVILDCLDMANFIILFANF